jgi:hypothetical protein
VPFRRARAAGTRHSTFGVGRSTFGVSAFKIPFTFPHTPRLLTGVGAVKKIMKTNPNSLWRISTFLFVSTGLAVAFIFGCSKQQPAQPAQAPQKSAIVSASKTSFDEVTSQLDPGGNFYIYLSTAQWLENLSSKTEQWRDSLSSMPDVTADQKEKIDQAFTVLNHVIQDSGIQDLSGLGASSIEIEPGLFRNKAVLHHYPDKGSGFMWQLAGQPPHPLDGLDLLPTDTAMAIFTDANVPLLWTVAQQEAKNSGIPDAGAQIQKLPAEFEKRTGIKWDQFLSSLGGEFGLVLTLDPSNTVTLPYPPSNPATVPNPALMLVVKVNDDTIYNRIDQALKEKQLGTAVDKPGFKMRTVPLPLPLQIQLRPSAASSAGYLLIASDDDLIKSALDVKNGKEPGLKSTGEFKRLSQNLPTEGNHFSYASSLFGLTVIDLQKQIMANSPKQAAAQTKWMQSLIQSHPPIAYSVGMNTSEGCVVVGNSSQSYAMAAILPAVAVSGTLAAIAIPNFVKAREVSQRNACINNLRRIEAAKNEWALENNKTNGDTPTKKDLLPYLRRWPVCPSGGTYTINPLGEAPTCSIAGHKLP